MCIENTNKLPDNIITHGLKLSIGATYRGVLLTDLNKTELLAICAMLGTENDNLRTGKDIYTKKLL